ncbi:hypothetical protein ACS0PU_010057 [Formica fusca]
MRVRGREREREREKEREWEEEEEDEEERRTQERRRYSEDGQRGQVRCCVAGGRPQRRAGSEQVTGSSAPSSAVPRHGHSRSALGWLRWMAIPYGFADIVHV